MKIAWVGLSVICSAVVSGLLVPSNVRAASPVVINEFMAHPASGEDWIELYNTSSSDISINNWLLKDNSTSVLKTLSGVIPANSYLTIDVSTRLNNGGDSVILVDAASNELDRYDFTSDPGTNVSIGKYPNGTGAWMVLSIVSKGQSNGGESIPSPSANPSASSTPVPTPLSADPTPSPTLSPTPTPSPVPSGTGASSTPSASPTATTQSIGGNQNNAIVRLSEYLPAPPTGEYEWVELYNASPFEANVASWQLDDLDGGSSPLVIPAEGNSGLIPPVSYKVYIFASAKLNNGGDTIRLLKPDGSIVEQSSYTDAKTDTAFAKDMNDTWHETTTATPGEQNVISSPDTKVSASPSLTAPASSAPSPSASASVIRSSSSLPVVLGLASDNQESTESALVFNNTLPFLQAFLPQEVLVQSASDSAEVSTPTSGFEPQAIMTYSLSFLAISALGGGYYLYTSGRMNIWLQKIRKRFL